MNFSYAFILGRLPALSIAEILAVMKKLKMEYQINAVSQKMLILDVKEEADFKEILKTMGGTIKIIQILKNFPLNYFEKQNEILPVILNLFQDLSRVRLSADLSHRQNVTDDRFRNEFGMTTSRQSSQKTENLNTKIIIGYSICPIDNKIEKKEFNQFSKFIKSNLIALKKELKKEGTGCRIVMPKNYEAELSSASIVNNKILKKGIDLNFILTSPRPLLGKEGSIQIMLGKTAAIQDIESYSRRDYGRPCREAKIGMMPPKLAQIMINLAQVKEDQLILDPFCGTGVILQEALLAGCHAIGSDANEKQVQNAKTNLKWLEENYLSDQLFPSREGLGVGFSTNSTHPQPPPERGLQIFKIDAAHLAKKINHSSVNAIVTETTLGPIYTKSPAPREIRKNFKKLEKIYLKFLTQAKKVLLPGGKIVMTAPCYQTKNSKFILMPIVDILKKTGYSIKEPLPKDISDKLALMSGVSSRNTLIYSRKGQIVGREIIVLEL